MDLKKSLQTRFNSLAGDRKNVFSFSKQKRDSSFDDNNSSKEITKGRYVPPSKRNANKSNNDNDKQK